MAPPSGNMIETLSQDEFQHGSFPVGFEQISALRILFSGYYNKRVREGKRGEAGKNVTYSTRHIRQTARGFRSL